ncbi:Glycoside hydrolase 35 catalytic domain-containing protein [Caenorhabditis elegans]|uniref:Glycoside hydrolase 35 catalytic domain-containing protein n=1 Tax=Caenorhabditis elegans TaxID=6239 RepID=O76632_CAEEL|nr:Glycoside hydrolase 35 catalytic domain-containing protein [Caenorhabditis elegans]CCD72416.2 Glycoside hydrolase 35 catalytic domain-containing protein [Caenorhabditis elegans]|eukprot:NP_509140.2 Beta GALactosidase homolog [Caenorhabditis elegans]
MRRELALFLVCSVFATVFGTDSSPSFKIDTVNSQFLLDGDPFTYIAGEIHYFRIPHQKWDDRLKRVRALGFNAITVPVPWNLHQFYQDETPILSGNLDLVKFIKAAESNGLYTILRIGPYISAEWDNGGLPWWLIRNTKIGKYRSSDPSFMTEVTQWWKHLLPKIYPLMRKNAGPVLMVQIEHFYGALGICDQQYLLQLANMAKENLGNDVVLFTVNPPVLQFMRCGTLPNILPTIEIVPNANAGEIESWFSMQKAFMQGAPAVASQFLINPFKLWGKNVSDPYPNNLIIQTAKTAFALNASLSFHMTHGGTNFGYWNGAVDPYPVTTSYDSFAPISEAGDVNPLYISIRNWISNIPGWQNPPTPIPANLPRTAYPDVQLTVFDTISGFIIGANPECWSSPETPRTAEYIRQGYGYIYYNTTIIECGSLYIPTFADNAYIFLNQNFVGALYKQFGSIHNNTIDVQGCLDQFNSLEIIIEITGRDHNNYPVMSRGIQGNVYMRNITLENWESCEVPIETYEISLVKNYESLKQHVFETIDFEKSQSAAIEQPSVFIGNLIIKTAPADTFLDTRGWGKGVVTINQYNIGRYWASIGPQQTLYIPSEFLHKGENLIMFYEFEGATTACTATACTAKFTNIPVFDY